MNATIHTLKIIRQLNHEPERVFSALTDPAKMSRWFFGARGDHAVVSNDLRPGGKYSIDMQTPGVDCLPHGIYLEIVPPHRLAFTWASHAGDEPTRVTIELTATAEGTQLVLTHELPVESVDGHRQGWNECLDSLARFLAV